MKAKEFDIFKAPLMGIGLVEAGAGTGKTYNIASLFVRFILEKKLLPLNILVLTYTEAATAELKSRLRNRLKESISVLEGEKPKDTFLEEVKNRFTVSDLPHLKEALYKFDEAPVSTIHGFCQRLLKESPIEFGVSPEFEILTDDSELIQEIIDKVWREFFADSESEFKQAFQKFIIEKKYDPDKLKGVLSPILSKPYAKVVPEVKSIEEYASDFEKLHQVFVAIRSSFKQEKERFEEVVKSGVLYKNSLNAEDRYFLPKFEEWLGSENATLSPYEHIKYFSSYLYERVTKGNEIPDFAFIKKTDEYLKKLDIFLNLESLFIQNVASEVIQKYESEKQRNALLTYDDLLQKTEQGLIQDNSELIRLLRKKYPVALIDEFQDTDPIQYSIFKTLYVGDEETSLFMIGDPKQAIYKFRGADIYTYLRAQKDVSQERCYSLTYNYRSNPEMINAVNSVFGYTKQPFILPSLDFKRAQFPTTKDSSLALLTKKGEKVEALQFLEIESTSTKVGDLRHEVAESTVSEVIELLNGNFEIDGNSVKESDITILVRKHDQALVIQDLLRERGIKSVIRSRESVFESREADDLYLILRAISNLNFEDGIRAALSSEAFGFNASEIINLSGDQERWEKLLERFDKLHQLWKLKGFSAMAEEMIHLFEIRKKLAKYFDGERRITNLNHLIELLRKAEVNQKLPMHSLVRFFKAKRANPSRNKDAEMIRLESDEELVQIVTVHASKGLEYSIVFCPYLWDAGDGRVNFPISFHQNGANYIDLGTNEALKNEHKLQYQTEELAESVRLMYVALTRAKTACFVHVMGRNSLGISALVSISEGSEVVLDRLGKKNQPHEITEHLVKMSESEAIGYCSASTNKAKLDKTGGSEEVILSSKKFTGKNLSQHFSIGSFSSLTESVTAIAFEEDKPGFDYDDIESNKIDDSIQIFDRFHLKKGADVGTMLHNIFEKIVFNEPESLFGAIREETIKTGLNEDWIPVILKLVSDSLEQQLVEGISLNKLEYGDYLPEIEFHLPSSSISYQKLIEIIRGTQDLEEESSINGFLKGYIDLTFRFGGKYYILDYKSNHLGNSFEDYSREALGQEIIHSNYDVQYHLYTLALHRMLEQSVSGYDYESHFGGALYLFLRGVNPSDPGSGVFYHKPEKEIILSLDKLLKGDENV
ncbi:MAG: exodeoxyribonuclease V subunit beta [Balneola sp.]